MKTTLISLGVLLTLAAISFGVYSLSTSPTTSSSTSPTNSSSTTTNQSTSGASISSAQLAQNNGKNGAKCWVAVNGTVYDVTGNRQWVNGEHVPSNGQAKCGRDESSTIGQSPHGTSVLGRLPVIGQLN